ncbi:hypothetical protein PHB09_132 [Pseudomonas phage PHB09]|uniref:Uncharacterized protein n=1 Tax=Pseudomonas phage PHB09 TaxID=2867265 RepID=A0AAE8XE31_9CAUD|nr:hypothetical protein QGX10_gp131 [Pseudomonas phage PHB09]UAV84627.1 hypothetical protein PHB09_132 [Pseudomonas phage PHB09]
MTTDDRIKYIESFIRLIAKSESYDQAYCHANFTRGLLAAWNIDNTISTIQWKRLYDEVDLILDVKRNIPKVVDKELF